MYIMNARFDEIFVAFFTDAFLLHPFKCSCIFGYLILGKNERPEFASSACLDTVSAILTALCLPSSDNVTAIPERVY